MKIVTITTQVVFDDDVPNEAIETIASNAWVQYDEPVVGWDDDGNEIELAPAAYQAATQTIETRFVEPDEETSCWDVAVALRNA